MKKQSAYTIATLLEELREELPHFRKNQVFETLKSIYPNDTISRDKKNIVYKGKLFTKPLAVSKKDKSVFLKEDSVIQKFFRSFSKGDFLRVMETDGKIAKCINESIKKEIVDRFYKEELITITLEDIANGTVKFFRRKIDKYLED